MTSPRYSLLTGRGVLRVSGPETRTFLQGLVTNDVARLDDKPAMSSALLTPQGKILFDFLLVRDGDDVLVDCAGVHRADLAKRLTFYKLRAKVDITDESDTLSVAAFRDIDQTSSPGDGLIVFTDPRLPELGTRVIGPDAGIRDMAEATGAVEVPEEDHTAERVRSGVAEGGLELESGQYFPHDVNLDQLAGVDFRKGCYVGQEVVSRMHHKSTVRKRVLPVRLGSGASAAGSEIRASGKPIGTLLADGGTDGLALLRLDRLEAALAEGADVTVDDRSVTVVKPAWAKFDVPGAADSGS